DGGAGVSTATGQASSATRASGRRASPAQPMWRRVRSWFGRNWLRIYAVLAFAYLFLPIAYVTVFSFNIPGRSNLTWRGFTLQNWTNPCGAPDVCEAVGNSLKIGITATIVATILG